MTGFFAKQVSERCAAVFRHKPATTQEPKRTKRWPANARLLSLRKAEPAPPQERQRSRGAAAALRLDAARITFDLSVVALRKAALDHVDVQDLASTALRANLSRLVGRLGAAA